MDSADRRTRLGRLPPLVLRQIDGDSYAIEAHEEAPEEAPRPSGAFVVQLEYDDGNGLFIRNG